MSDNRRKHRPSLTAVDKALADAGNFIGLILRRQRMVRDTHYLCYPVLKLIVNGQHQ